MRKYLFLILIAIFFIGCKANTDLPETNNTESESGSRDTTNQTENQTKSYPKLKVENKKNTSEVIYVIELPNYKIEPVAIASGESATFELINGMLQYENVTIKVSYAVSRSDTFRSVYFRKNFADGQTTTVTLQ